VIKAGETPEGLMIISKGQCIVCAEKLAMTDEAKIKDQKNWKKEFEIDGGDN
jgi:hypothetical protein